MQCMDCIWCEQCPDSSPCEGCTPFFEDQEQMIEDGRVLFREEWNEYIGEMG